ncbi:hypothetical protein HYH02_001024 [Chlamydomonas schloesseri]|uniref:cyclin-dependent kinase n=1 Tax=Chlamydomonas schloesseri TaxID=2026947 RepID=A0A835WVI0_9CHLO|nr:hypothetical protein HYH02_001024 [Chlamydomonas schloesseri]|eukprot:KAG2453978.1 hypothetical protein HYH02_001024 [Chlamydomonas schloesseri]
MMQADSQALAGSPPMQRSYDFVSVIDEGAYGTVFACVQQPAGTVVAIKQCKHATDPLVRRLLLREIRILRSLPRHPCVVALLDAFRSQSSGRPHLVFEHMERSLHKDLDARGGSGEPPCAIKAKLVAWQLFQGLTHLHAQKVVHRDIKPANVLLSGSGTATVAKLCDFGFAREVSSSRPEAQERLSSYVVTRWYRAPEILVGDRYGMAADVWSLGCTLAEMACQGVPLFPGASTLDQLARIMRCFGPLPPGQTLCLHTDKRLAPLRKPPPRSRNLAERLKGVDPHLLDLISACLTLDPLRRPSARALLGAAYFRDVPLLLLAGSPLAPSLAPLLEQQAAQGPAPQPHPQRAASKRALEEPAGADTASSSAGAAAAAAAAAGGGGRSASDTSGAAAAAARKRPSDVLPRPSVQLVSSMQTTKAASDSLIDGGGGAVSGGSAAAAATMAPADAARVGAAPAQQVGASAPHTRISEVRPAAAPAAVEDGVHTSSAAAVAVAAMPGPQPSDGGVDGGAAGARPSCTGGPVDPTAPDRWASTISEPPPPGYRYDRTVSIGVDGLSAPTGADAGSALQSSVILGSDLVLIGPGGGSCRDVQPSGYGSTATAGVAAAAAVAMDAVARRLIPDAGSERLLQPLPLGSELPPLLPPPMPLLQPLDAPLQPPVPMQPLTRPRGGVLGLDVATVAPVSADGSSSSKLRQLLLQPFMVSGGSGSAALGLLAPEAGVAARASQPPAAAGPALGSSGGLAGGDGGGRTTSTSPSSIHSLRAAARSRGLPLLTLAPHEIAAAVDEAAAANASAATATAAAAAAAVAAGMSIDGLVAQGVISADGASDDDEDTVEATVAALLAASTPGRDGSPAVDAAAAAPAAARALAPRAPVVIPVRSSPRAASTAAARRASCAAAIGGDATVSSSTASNAFDGLVTLGSPALAVPPPPLPPLRLLAPSLVSSMTAATSPGGLHGAAVAAATGAAAVEQSNIASGDGVAAVPTPPAVVAAAALAAGQALRRPAREQRVAAGGPPRVVRASASMVEFVPPAPWLPPHHHQQQQQQQQEQQQAMLLLQHTAGSAVVYAGGGGSVAGRDGGLGCGTAPGTGTGGTGPRALGSGAGGSSFGGLSLVKTNINNKLHPGAADASDTSNRILRNLDFSMLPDQHQQHLQQLLPSGAPPALSHGAAPGVHNPSLHRPGAAAGAAAAAAAAAATAAGHKPPPPPPLVHMPHVRGAISTTAAAVAALVAGTPTFVSVSQLHGGSGTAALIDTGATLPGAFNYSSASAAAGAASAAGGGGGGGSALSQFQEAEPYHETLYEDEGGDGNGGGGFKAAAPPRVLQAHMNLFQQQARYVAQHSEQSRPMRPPMQQLQQQVPPPHTSWDHQRGPTPSSVSSVGCLNSGAATNTANGVDGVTPAPRLSQLLELAAGGGGEAGNSAQQRVLMLQPQQQQPGSARRALVGVPVALASLLPGMSVNGGGAAAGDVTAVARAGGCSSGGGSGYVIGAAAAAASLSGGGGLGTSGNSGSGSRMRVGEVVLGAMGSSSSSCGLSRGYGRPPLGVLALDVLSEEPTAEQQQQQQQSATLQAAQQHAQQQQQQQQAVARQQLHSCAAAAAAVSTACLPGATSPPVAFARASSRLGQLSRLSRSVTDAAPPFVTAAAAATPGTAAGSMATARDVTTVGDGAAVVASSIGTAAAANGGGVVPGAVGSNCASSGAGIGATAGPASAQARSRFTTEQQQLPSSCASAGYIRLTSLASLASAGGGDDGGGDEAPYAGTAARPGATAGAAASAPSAAASRRLPAGSVVVSYSAKVSAPLAVPPVEALLLAVVATAPVEGARAGMQQEPPPVVPAAITSTVVDRDRQQQQQQQQHQAPMQRRSSGLGGLLARVFACGRGSLPYK